MKKKLFYSLFILLSLVLFPCVAYANSPGPATMFWINIQNVPEGAVGVDVLAPVSSIPEDAYLDEKKDVLADAGLSPDCELASYDDGFVSCLAHYKDVDYALSFEAKEKGGASVHLGGYTGHGNNVFSVLREMNALKLLVYDKQGNVLAVSDSFNTASSFRYVFRGNLTYDAASGHVDVKMDESSPYAILTALMPIVLIISMLGTMLIEVLIGKAFSMQPLSRIAFVTAITNLVMNLLFYLMMATIPGFSPLPYLAGLEIAVIVVEFLVYKKKYPHHSTKHVLQYTVIANAVSAFVGVLFWSSV